MAQRLGRLALDGQIVPRDFKSCDLGFVKFVHT